MNCPSCDAPALETARFCSQCGTELTKAVRRNDLERLVPRQYLDQLAATRGRPVGERRVVTILFCDVKGSTAMAEGLDPEDVMEIMNGAFEALVGPIYRYEGTLARLMGDAILAFFGAPVAHEDDAVRACRAALDILDCAREYAGRLERERGITGFNVRVGINTGLVVVGEVGADLRVEYTAMGDAVNLAARMESAAEPGTALITRDTHDMVSEVIDTKALDSLAVKGRKEPVDVFRVLRARSLRRVPREERRSAFVGRAHPLETLRLALAGLRAGSGVSVAVTGAAGMGKTRLIDRAREIAPPGLTWADSRSASFARETSYWSAREMVHALIGCHPGQSPGELAAGLERALGEANAAHGDELRSILGPGGTDPVVASAPERRERIATAFATLIESVARETPLVTVWDDCQWIDEHSLGIVQRLAGMCTSVPLVVVAAFRDDAAGLMSTDGFDVVLELQPFDRAESEELASSLLSGVPVPPTLVTEVIGAAQGNPFFLEGVLGSLKDVAAMVDSGWNVRNLSVPTTLHGAVMSRVDGLAPRDKDTLQAASVAGRVFSPAVLSHVCRQTTELDASLEELCRRDFIHASTSGEYAFRQPMTAEVAYESLLKSRRIELHRRTGEAIERLYPGRLVELSPVLAYHYEAAGAREKAFEYLVRAARRASGVSAAREAVRRYRRALAIVGTGTDISPAPTVVRDLAALHEEVADAHLVTGNYDDARAHYDAAGGLLDDDSRLVTVRRKTAHMLQRWRKHDEARDLFESLLDSDGKPLDTTEAGHIYSGLGMACYHDGEFDRAHELARRALESMAATDDRSGVARSLNDLGVIQTRRGEHDAAAEFLRRALVEYEQLGDEYGLAIAHNNLGLALRERSELDAAASEFERSAALFEKIGNRHGLACACDNLGQVHMDRNDADAAHECLKRAVAIMAEISLDRDEMRPEMWHTGAM